MGGAYFLPAESRRLMSLDGIAAGEYGVYPPISVSKIWAVRLIAQPGHDEKHGRFTSFT